VIWPINSNGYSTGFAPIQVSTKNDETVDQKIIFFIGLNFDESEIFFLKGKIAIIKIDKSMAITPPNLFGIDRRIAYANRKYHSGWIWIGVLNGLAILKFSGSPIINGNRLENVSIIIINKIIPIMSFDEKNGWKEILSMFLYIPKGDLDPVKCRDIRWIISIALKIKGIRKWIAKKRLRVAPLTEKPPQSHSTISDPI